MLAISFYLDGLLERENVVQFLLPNLLEIEILVRYWLICYLHRCCDQKEIVWYDGLRWKQHLCYLKINLLIHVCLALMSKQLYS